MRKSATILQKGTRPGHERNLPGHREINHTEKQRERKNIMKKHSLKEIMQRKMTLIVSLPENDRETAYAVQEAGADAIKVHLNCHHRASGTLFGTWEEERARISDLPSKLEIPVGIVPGAETVATRQEMEEIRQSGFDFLDIFAHHMPCSFFALPDLGKVIAIDYTFPFEMVMGLVKAGTEIIEASIINPQGYGERLTARDLAYYRSLVAQTPCPLFIPTQRKIEVHDLPYLYEIGARGIAIGAIVTGKKREEIAATTKKFRDTLDHLNRLEGTLTGKAG
jgi:hypothetical protein